MRCKGQRASVSASARPSQGGATRRTLRALLRALALALGRLAAGRRLDGHFLLWVWRALVVQRWWRGSARRRLALSRAIALVCCEYSCAWVGCY